MSFRINRDDQYVDFIGKKHEEASVLGKKSWDHLENEKCHSGSTGTAYVIVWTQSALALEVRKTDASQRRSGVLAKSHGNSVDRSTVRKHLRKGRRVNASPRWLIVHSANYVADFIHPLHVRRSFRLSSHNPPKMTTAALGLRRYVVNFGHNGMKSLIIFMRYVPPRTGAVTASEISSNATVASGGLCGSSE